MFPLTIINYFDVFEKYPASPLPSSYTFGDAHAQSLRYESSFVDGIFIAAALLAHDLPASMLL